ncbi:unnamed protein product, partial [Rotaria sp. Silwood1]
MAKVIRALLDTVIQALPEVGNLCSPRLRYFDAEIVGGAFSFFGEENCSKQDAAVMPTLRTLVLYFETRSSITMGMLRQYLNSMPVLKYLEIKAHSELLDANAWKMLLETSLPLLTHFTLRTTSSCVEEIGLQHEHWDSIGFGIDETKSHVRHEFDWPVIQCWTAPNHTNNNDLMI